MSSTPTPCAYVVSASPRAGSREASTALRALAGLEVRVVFAGPAGGGDAERADGVASRSLPGLDSGPVRLGASTAMLVAAFTDDRPVLVHALDHRASAAVAAAARVAPPAKFVATLDRGPCSGGGRGLRTLLRGGAARLLVEAANRADVVLVGAAERSTEWADAGVASERLRVVRPASVGEALRALYDELLFGRGEPARLLPDGRIVPESYHRLV